MLHHLIQWTDPFVFSYVTFRRQSPALVFGSWALRSDLDGVKFEKGDVMVNVSYFLWSGSM